VREREDNRLPILDQHMMLNSSRDNLPLSICAAQKLGQQTLYVDCTEEQESDQDNRTILI